MDKKRRGEIALLILKVDGRKRAHGRSCSELVLEGVKDYDHPAAGERIQSITSVVASAMRTQLPSEEGLPTKEEMHEFLRDLARNP